MARITVGASSQSQIPPPHNSTRASSGTSGPRITGGSARCGGSVRTPNGTTAKRSRASGSSSSRPASTPSQRSRWRSLAHSVEVGGGEVRGGRPPHDPVQPRAGRGGLAARRLDRLDDGRVVEVDDEPRRLAPDAREQPRRQQLRDHDVVVADGGDQRVVVGEPGLEQLEALVAQRARRRGGEGDPDVGGERASKLVRTDGRPGHPVADRLGGDHEDTRSRQAGEYGDDLTLRDGRATRRGALCGSMLGVTGLPPRRQSPCLGAGLTLLVLAVGVRQPAGRGAGRAGALRAGARRRAGCNSAGATFEPTAEQREAFLGAGWAGGAAAGRGPRRRCCGRRKQTRAFDVPLALSVTHVRLQRSQLGGLGGVPRQAARRAAVAAGADLHRHVRAVRLRRPGRGDAHAGLTRGRVARGAPRERADLPRAADRRDRPDRRWRGAGRDGRGADADGRLLRVDPERLGSRDRGEPLLHRRRVCGSSDRGPGRGRGPRWRRAGRR